MTKWVRRDQKGGGGGVVFLGLKMEIGKILAWDDSLC